MLLFMLLFGSAFGAKFTLPGECPDVKLHERLDYTKLGCTNHGHELTEEAFINYPHLVSPESCGTQHFTISEVASDEKSPGTWYNVANYASDGRSIYDCASLDFQEDNLGYTLRETYVDPHEAIFQGNRTQKSYFARVDPTFDAGNKAQFIVSHEDGDKILQFPFFILSTDYDDYAIAYTCKTLKTKERKHYVFTWVLSRKKEKLEGETLKNVEDALSKYTELADHRQSFVFKDFSEASCDFTNKLETDFFTSNFW